VNESVCELWQCIALTIIEPVAILLLVQSGFCDSTLSFVDTI
jgi:hypothetical protein